MVGQTVAHYRVLAPVGTGGMGVVYLAEDTILARKVALKFLSPTVAEAPHSRARFLKEAQAESAVDHPNIATIYEIGEWEQQLFIVMAYYEGDTLRGRLARGAMSVDEATAVLRQIAAGLAAAHRAGIVHRDLKPANVMLTRDGQVKILDFGLAKVLSDNEKTATRMTATGMVVGTIAYMAPEQARGEEVDARADIWAFGVIAYEMFAGQLPFKGENTAAVLLSLLTETPAAIQQLRPDVPDGLAHIVSAALEKQRARRIITADDIVARLSAAQTPSSSADGAVPPQLPQRSARRSWTVGVLALALAVVAVLGWYVRMGSRSRSARERALPAVERLVEQEKYLAAFRLADEVRRIIPGDPVWARLDPVLSRVASVTTTPPGAKVYYREYGSATDDWTYLGESPLTDARIPNAFLVWKVERTGFAPSEDATGQYPTSTPSRPALRFTLHKTKSVPPGMVHVTTGATPFRPILTGFENLPRVTLHDFWIDKYEVTNLEYKRFVDAGGYRTRAYWRHPFVKDGRTLTFEQGTALLTDSTGRPGPAGWESGSYPDGQDDYPVGGVSWYEAAAYAEFAGKSLPTIYHWSRVADQAASAFSVPHSNFGGRGPMKVGASGGLNRFGAVDMAGNMKEWCWNAPDASRRYILGGAWDEPVYTFNDPEAKPLFDRGANHGFRCVRYSSGETLADSSAQLVPCEVRDYSKERPVGDTVFDVYRGIYAYDRTDLKSVVESVDDQNPEWRRENVSFTAGHGSERLAAAVFVPKTGRPPYQAVVVFPGSGAIQMATSRDMDVRRFEWVMKSGRAAIHPVYKGTFERRDGLESDNPNRSIAYRDHVIAWAREVSRAIDYLETRDEIAAGRSAYLGFSWGAAMGPVFVALEPRFKACVLVMGGFSKQSPLPEVDPLNFASRVRTPTLLLNGRYDFYFPEDTTQIPMFRLFDVPDDRKRRVVYETGHTIPRADLIRESLDWFDRYLGPVR